MYKTDFITDYALKWLDEAFKKGQLFFLYLVSKRKRIIFQKFHIYDFISQGWFRLRPSQINVFP